MDVAPRIAVGFFRTEGNAEAIRAAPGSTECEIVVLTVNGAGPAGSGAVYCAVDAKRASGWISGFSVHSRTTRSSTALMTP